MNDRERYYTELSKKKICDKIEEIRQKMKDGTFFFDHRKDIYRHIFDEDENESVKKEATYPEDVPLVTIAVKSVCKKMNDYLKDYLQNEGDIPEEERPSFGVLANTGEVAAKKIIEHLIETESLKPIHLKVLLEKNTTHLPCNENSRYTPFNVETLRVISRRCSKFQELHFHSNVRILTSDPRTNRLKESYIEGPIDDSLLRLSTSVTELNFTDAGIDSRTLKLICNSFKSLKVLNLHQASIDISHFEVLVNPECVIKNTVENLRVDNTSMPTAIIGRCLERYKNLKYFRSDATITALLFLEKVQAKITEPLEITIVKQKFNNYREIPDSELKEKLTNIVKKFPKVDHMIFTTIQRLATKFVNEIITSSMINITKLELSCFQIDEEYDFIELMPAFENERLCDTLTSLTIECYFAVDVFYLMERCEKLEEIVLVNNTYKICNKNYWMPLQKLRELKIMFLSEVKHNPEHLSKYHMDVNTLCALMSPKSLKKLIIVNQNNFEMALTSSIDSGFLSKLEEIYFFSCEVRLEILMKLLEFSEILQKVEYSNDSIHKGTTEKILELIDDNYYGASVFPRDNLPYWLRWSLISIKYFRKVVK